MLFARNYFGNMPGRFMKITEMNSLKCKHIAKPAALQVVKPALGSRSDLVISVSTRHVLDCHKLFGNMSSGIF